VLIGGHASGVKRGTNRRHIEKPAGDWNVDPMVLCISQVMWLAMATRWVALVVNEVVHWGQRLLVKFS
jgi:hypothetical protein